MQLLTAFAGLSMCCAALMALLPEGAMRKTAMLAAGLLLAALWVEGLPGWLAGPQTMETSAGWLMEVRVPTPAERQAQWMGAKEESDGQAAGVAAP